LAHCPRLCISAKTGRNVDALFPLIDTVNESMARRIPTHKLNKALMEWMQRTHPTMVGGKRLRIYYMAQVDTHPPRFVLFVNTTKLLDEPYRRYLINQLRKDFRFEGVPFVLSLKGKAKGRTRASRTHTDHTQTDHDLSSLAAVLEDIPQD
jgi:GTPase